MEQQSIGLFHMPVKSGWPFQCYYNTDSSPRIVAEMACSLDMGKYIVDFLTILAYNKGEKLRCIFFKRAAAGGSKNESSDRKVPRFCAVSLVRGHHPVVGLYADWLYSASNHQGHDRPRAGNTWCNCSRAKEGRYFGRIVWADKFYQQYLYADGAFLCIFAGDPASGHAERQHLEFVYLFYPAYFGGGCGVLCICAVPKADEKKHKGRIFVPGRWSFGWLFYQHDFGYGQYFPDF